MASEHQPRIVLREAGRETPDASVTLVDRETAPVQPAPVGHDPLLKKQIEETTAYIRELFSQEPAQ